MTQKNVLCFFLFLLISLTVQAQRIMQPREKAFNWGMKVGGNAALPVITSFQLGDNNVGNVQLNNRVGYSLEMFGRVNVDRFFLQPSFIWSYSNGSIGFTLPNVSGASTATNSATSSTSQFDFSIHSLEVPICIGYNVVKDGPYALSLLVGGKFRYNYKINYESLYTLYEYGDDHTPYDLSALAGVSVSIGRLFFDASYDLGLRQVRSSFINPTSSDDPSNITLKKRMNTIKISFGFIF